ncbi:hypothetical protein GOB94_11705 [Granulicella sp. 5B5]|uniref:hypothetical protein n=1 Tax=Granulicella sp. 5B5 TaxID=1617967 RepID=UPI0015F73E9F|nr:hypothetical protein [Granulicella sp. 5B5]QMV19272.1 hypothetical protein GOB94_11705 [Granulicella sp. 5B5]
MPAITCRHIRTNGARCGSPALSGRAMCYHHGKVAHHHRGLAPQPADDTPTILHPISSADRTQRDPILAEPVAAPLILDFPPLEDRESIQLALSMVITAMAQNRIDPRRATAILYGLQVASSNCRHIAPEVPPNVVREVVIEDGQQLAPDEDPVVETTSSTLSRLVDLLHQHAESLAEPELAPLPPQEPQLAPDESAPQNEPAPVDESSELAAPSCPL